MKKISVVAPMYNEEENVAEFYNRVKKVMHGEFSDFEHEMVVVDDGSSDATYRLLKELHEKDHTVNVVRLSRNFGHQVAISAALDHATGDYIVMMDADLQDLPEQIPTLYNKLMEGYDVVYGDRQNKKFWWLKRFCSALFRRVMSFLVNYKIEVDPAVFRIMTRQVLTEVKRLGERTRFIIGLIGWVGFSHTTVKVPHGDRFAGETKYPFSKSLKLAMDALFSFSDFPLQFVTRFGFAIVFLSGLLIATIIPCSLLYGFRMTGWASLLISIFFMGGVQIFVAGVLGEYIGRIYVEVKQRPLYVVRQRLMTPVGKEGEAGIMADTRVGKTVDSSNHTSGA